MPAWTSIIVTWVIHSLSGNLSQGIAAARRTGTGHERLVLAAIDAIKRARIDPAREDGRPIASTVRVPFNFVLR
jgi:hypothetical protein